MRALVSLLSASCAATAILSCSHTTVHVSRVLPLCGEKPDSIAGAGPKATHFLVGGTALPCTTSFAESNPEGFRYFLPRPFLAVKQEFPVATVDMFVSGTVSGDGQWLLLTKEDLKNVPAATVAAFGLENLPGAKAGEQGVRATAIAVGTTTLQGKGGGGGGGGGKDGGGGGGGGSGSGSDQGSGSAAPSGGGKDGGGGGGGKDAGGSTASAPSTTGGHITIDGAFDVLYMPDYDEEFAIYVKDAGVDEWSVQLTNGWMLENMAVKTDRTALTTAISAATGKALDLASSITLGKLGLAAGAAGAAGTGSGSAAATNTSLQGKTDDKTVVPNQRVLIHVQEVTYAIPGLYPIYKPAEIRALKTPADDAQRFVFHSRIWSDYLEVETRHEVFLSAMLATTPQPAAAARDDDSLTTAARAAIKDYAAPVGCTYDIVAPVKPSAADPAVAGEVHLIAGGGNKCKGAATASAIAAHLKNQNDRVFKSVSVKFD